MSEHLIEAEDARGDILTCAAFVAEGVKSNSAHADSIKAVVPQYLAKGNVDLAAELANTVDDPFSRDRLLIVVAEKCAELNDDDYAFQLADAIEDHGLRNEALERIAMKKSAIGEYDKAEEIATGLSHPDYVYADMAVRHFLKDDRDASQNALAAIQFPSAKVTALQAMASERITAKKDGAAELLEEAATSADEIEHDEERTRALYDIGTLYLEAGRNDKAIETFDAARAEAEEIDNTHRDNFLAAISLGFLQAGSVDLADRTLDGVADKTQTASSLVGFSKHFAKAGEKDEAMEALDEAYAIWKSQKDSETRDSKAKAAVLTAIATQYAELEKSDRAIEVALENVKEDQQYAALAQTAQVSLLKGNEDMARQAIKAITDDVNHVFGLISLSDAAEKAGNKEKAIEILEEAASETDGIQRLGSRSGACAEIASRFAVYDMEERAREMILEDLDVISQIKDDGTRAVALARIARNHTEAEYEVSEAEKEYLKKLAV